MLIQDLIITSAVHWSRICVWYNKTETGTDPLHPPAPLAWTTLSGIRSRSKWAISSVKTTSWTSRGPLGPAVCRFSLSPMGWPPPVVSVSVRCYKENPGKVIGKFVFTYMNTSIASWISLSNSLLNRIYSVLSRNTPMQYFVYYVYDAHKKTKQKKNHTCTNNANLWLQSCGLIFNDTYIHYWEISCYITQF